MIATRLPSLAAVAWLGAGLAGCLSVPVSPEAMCASTSDCDGARGEVCEEGVCWGNPPPGPFAAVISPPSTRPDLVPREIALVPIPIDGWMGDLTLEVPVRMTGRVVAFCPPPMACDTATVGATITVSRASQFHGGPGFKAAVTVAPGAGAFSIPVPRTNPGDPPYTVTVVADVGRDPAGGSPNPLPPLRLQVAMPENATIRTELGGPDLPVLSGAVQDANNRPLAQYRVSALGRWDVTAPPTEVSTADITDATGTFSITLSDDLVGAVELVARPIGAEVAPTVHLANIDATKSSSRIIVVPATLGTPRALTVMVTGVDRSGLITEVSGALVSVTGGVTKTLNSFTVSDEQVTDDMGIATVHLLDGGELAGTYRLSITPPAGSTLGVLFDQKLVYSPGQPVATRLGARIAMRGKILDSRGNPLPNVAITARPSLRFLWTLEATPQSFVSTLPAATAVTLDSGEFLVWVDANVAQVWGHYDLLIEPPPGELAPTYLRTEVQIPRDGSLNPANIGEIRLPEPAFVHGRISGPTGDSLEKAELKLYQVSTALNLCDEVANAPASCPIPAQLRGRGPSDAEGIFRVTLPR